MACTFENKEGKEKCDDNSAHSERNKNKEKIKEIRSSGIVEVVAGRETGQSHLLLYIPTDNVSE